MAKLVMLATCSTCLDMLLDGQDSPLLCQRGTMGHGSFVHEGMGDMGLLDDDLA